MIQNTEARVREVLDNLNWLLDAHNSSATLIKIEGNKVHLLCHGECATCETECIQVAFHERMPDIEVIIHVANNWIVPPLKKKITALLENRDFQGISSLPASPYKIVNSLISLTYDKKSTVAWRAMEAVGLFTGSMAKQDTEFVRNIVGRLLWMIRDESGGIGWSVPEMLGEIVRNNPVICSDIALVLISFYEELMLATGVLWAAGSMGRVNEETAAYAVPLLRPFLNSSEAIQRGYAARALGALGASRYKTDIEGLIKDDNLIPVYHDGEIHEKTVGDMAAEALSIL